VTFTYIETQAKLNRCVRKKVTEKKINYLNRKKTDKDTDNTLENKPQINKLRHSCFQD
jgi:hypothetical protein